MTPKANLVVIFGAILIVIALLKLPQFSNLKTLMLSGKFSSKDVATTASPLEFIGIGLILLIVFGVVASASDGMANILLIAEFGLGVVELQNGL